MKRKRWFWAIGCDNANPSPYVADEGDLGEFDERLDTCQPVNDWPAMAWVKASSPQQDGAPDDVLQTCLTIPIFSSHLRSATEASGISGLQYLPIKVIRPRGELIAGFSIANILNCVEGLDLRLSAIQRFPDGYVIEERRGKVRSINRAVLIRRVVDQYDILRLNEYCSPIYVSEHFVQMFEAGKHTGYSFQEVQTAD